MTNQNCKNKCDKKFNTESKKNNCKDACSKNTKIECAAKCIQNNGFLSTIKCNQACNKK